MISRSRIGSPRLWAGTGFMLASALAVYAQDGDGSRLDLSKENFVGYDKKQGYSTGEKIIPGHEKAFQALFGPMVEQNPPKYLTCQYANASGQFIFWYAFWKDTVPANMAQMLDMVEPKHPLTVIGIQAVSECPQTVTEAAALKNDPSIGAEVAKADKKSRDAADKQKATQGLAEIIARAMRNSATDGREPSGQTGAPACHQEFGISPSSQPCGNSYRPMGSWEAKYWCYTDFIYDSRGVTWCSDGAGTRPRNGFLDPCDGTEGWCRGGLLE